MVATKRGAHLALSLERLDALLDRPAQRIGLSATVRPLDEVARFLGGEREAVIVNPPAAKTIELRVVVPVEDMAALDTAPKGDDGRASASIWPAVESSIVDLIQSHRSTIVFANSRRLAERLTTRLNAIAAERAGDQLEPADFSAATAQSGVGREAPVQIARAHHGSVSREQRAEIEEALKAGRLPAVVATSSLELGIDMGAVDLVIQVESPPSVASGLQRVGRAGHQVGAISRGVLFPKYRGDLLQSAVVAERMRDGKIESMRYPRNPLDVLAQQVVAMCALESWQVDDLAAVVRRAAPFASLPQSAFEAVLDMLSGRYPSDDFAELRPRITWDRVDRRAGRVARARSGWPSPAAAPSRTAACSASSWSATRARGSASWTRRWSTSRGSATSSCSGSSAWRIEDITHDRVLVTPAPGQPGRMPYWHGDAPGRPVELGRALGAFLRELSALDPERADARLAEAGLDANAAANLLAYLAEQREATGTLPDDRTDPRRAVPRRAGDWRLAIHSPFGAQVNQPWALALSARLRETYGVDVQSMHSDDGIVLRLPETEEAPDGSVAVSPPTTSSRRCRRRSAAARCSPAGSASAPPGRCCSPGATHPPHPAVAAAPAVGPAAVGRVAVRQLPGRPRDDARGAAGRLRRAGLVQLMKDVEARKVRLVEVETRRRRRSPARCCSATSAPSCTRATPRWPSGRARRCRSTAPCSPSCSARPSCASSSTPTPWTRWRPRSSGWPRSGRAKDLEGVADLLRMLGDLTTDEVVARGGEPAWLVELEGPAPGAARCASPARSAGSPSRTPAGCATPRRAPAGRGRRGVPEPVEDPVGDLVSRYARTHGPFHPADVAPGFGMGIAVRRRALARLLGLGRVGARRVPARRHRASSGATPRCSAQLRRRVAGPSCARRSSRSRRRAGRFLPQWQGVGAARRGTDGCCAPSSSCRAPRPGERAGDACCRAGRLLPPPCSTS
jgi:ATP-dependent Lhr-like helicase